MTAIRPIALAIPRRRYDLLVFEHHDRSKGETFYRPLGGGIEFGETAEAAVRREPRVELAVDLLDARTGEHEPRQGVGLQRLDLSGVGS